jgi:hypothetical protein
LIVDKSPEAVERPGEQGEVGVAAGPCRGGVAADGPAFEDRQPAMLGRGRLAFEQGAGPAPPAAADGGRPLISSWSLPSQSAMRAAATSSPPSR